MKLLKSALPLLSLAALLALVYPALRADAQIGLRHIHQERSLYRNIIVTEDSTRRCMTFTITRRNSQNQSCQFLEHPEQLVFPYARMTMASLLVQDNPQRILIVGLGGGTLPEAYHKLFPEAEILVTEIDAAVFRVAREYFDFEENDQVRVDIIDSRVHIKRAGLRGEQFDLVILDAFNGEYIPEHLMTEEFLQEVKALLPEHGMVVANTFSNSRLYDAESVTYQRVFGEFFNLSMPGSGNRVIIASMQELPDSATLMARAGVMYEKLSYFGMDVRAYAARMSRDVNWNIAQRPLTDQYAPANLLNN